MVAYFKRQNNLFMIIGALLGAIASALLYKPYISRQPGISKTLLLVLPVLFGVVLGRLTAARWATKKLGAITALLYRESKPEEFIEAFTPILEKTPANTVEFIDGRVRLAFACEALGEFDRGLEYLKDLNPDALKMHSLPANAIVCNQRIRLLLWKEELAQAADEMQKLQGIREAALYRAKALATQLDHVLSLYDQWRLVLEGETADESYLREEIELSKNRIHAGEMHLILAGAMLNRGADDEADEELRQAVDCAGELFPGRRAKELLEMAD